MLSLKCVALSLLVLLALTVLTNAENKEDCTCTERLCQKYPNLNYQCDETHYLECKDSKCTPRVCPDGTYYSTRTRQCEDSRTDHKDLKKRSANSI